MFVKNAKGLFDVKKMCYLFMLSVLLFSFSAVGHAEKSTKNLDNKLFSKVEAAIKKKNSHYVEGSLVILDSISAENSEALFVQYNSVRDNFFKKHHKETIFYDTEKDALVPSIKGKEVVTFVGKYKDDVGVKMSHIPMLLMLGACGLILYFVLYTTTSRSSFIPKL
jgi:hypothetical protein